MAVSGTAGGRIAPGVGANLIGQHAQDRNQDATIYVGNLDAAVTEEMVWELFTQAGPVVNVYLPKDRVTNAHQGYGFVEFRGEEDADYAIKVLNMIKVFSKPIRVNKASQDKKILDVGANLFIGNLDADVDEKLLYDTFGAFGVIIATPKIMRDPDNGNSRGFGFVSYDCFEAADSAIEAMNGQFLCNRPISVSYAFKKDTKGERHGTAAERVLATQQRAKLQQMSRPHTLFAAGPRDQEALMQQMAAQQTALTMGSYGASYQDASATGAAQWPAAAQQGYYQNADGTVPMWNASGTYAMQSGWQQQQQQAMQAAPPPNMPPPPMMAPRPMHAMPPPP